MENETKLRNFEPVAKEIELDAYPIDRNQFKDWKEFFELVKREEPKIPESATMAELRERHWY